MSIEALTWALNTPLGGNQKVLLIGVANHAHPDGSEAYPSLDRLAAYACCDRSTARRNVRKLIDLGFVIEDGLGPQGQAKYRLPLGGLGEGGWQNATGGILPQGGWQNAPGGGGTAMPPEPSFKPSKEPSERESARGRVWAHYQEVIPNGRRYRLDAARRRVIDAALELASVQECCEAITGLSRSDYHREHGYLDVSYALRGGGRNPRPDATILRMRAIAQGEVGAGNGRGRLQRATYSAGRTWDELTPGEQAVARDNAAMGVWPDEEREASAPAPSGPREAWTAETFGGDEE